MMKSVTNSDHIAWKYPPLQLAMIMLICLSCNAVLYYVLNEKSAKNEALLNISGRQRLQAETIALYSLRLALKPDSGTLKTELAARADALEENYYATRSGMLMSSQEIRAIYNNGELDRIKQDLVKEARAFALTAANFSNDAERDAKAQDILRLAQSLTERIDQVHESFMQFSTRQKYVQGGFLALSFLFSLLLIFWVVHRHYRAAMAKQQIVEERRKSHLQEIIDTSFNAIISIDQNQRITLFNKEAEKIFGGTAEQMLGSSLDVLIPSRFQVEHARHVAEFNAGADTTKAMGKWRTVSAVTLDGREFPVVARIARHKTDSGEFFSTVSLRDMTEVVRQEKVASQNFREVERANARLRGFFAQFTHELRTPLNIIVGFTDLALFGLSEASTEQTAQYLSHVVEAGKGLDKLISEMLDYRRIDEMVEEEAMEKLDVVNVINNVARQITLREESKFSLTWPVAEASITTYAIEPILNHFFEALFDLVVSKSNEPVTIQASVEENGIVFRETGGSGQPLLPSIFKELKKLKNIDFDEVIRSSSVFDIRILMLLKLSEACHIATEVDQSVPSCVRLTFVDRETLTGDSFDDDKRKSIIGQAVDDAVSGCPYYIGETSNASATTHEGPLHRCSRET